MAKVNAEGKALACKHVKSLDRTKYGEGGEKNEIVACIQGS